LQGETLTDSDGRLSLTIPGIFLADGKQASRTALVVAVVSSFGETPIAGLARINYHAAETFVRVRPASYLASTGTPIRLAV
jgi:hypothetical protein